jgi:Mn-dependent DtxR family transcriptional regulator
MNQLGLFDICRNRHRGNRHSESANASIAGAKEQIRSKILDYIREQGVDGATCEEIERALELSHQTASARCSELKKDGLVLIQGERKTKSGRSAAVLRVVK